MAAFTALLTQLEVANPGTLRMHEFVNGGDTYGTSEFSPVEMIQLLILAACGLLMVWVARYSLTQRPLAFLFGGLALVFFIRELHFFLDRYFIDNLWQVLVAIVGALLIAYCYRHRKRMNIALARIWPSPGLTLIFAGAVVLFAYSILVGHEPLWKAMLGEHYARIVKLAVEEFIELIGYFLWLIGTIEYVYQAKEMLEREPKPAARKRREYRRHH
jgi:multisubunit Na+/H+ antiporter MnhB subunit